MKTRSNFSIDSDRSNATKKLARIDTLRRDHLDAFVVAKLDARVGTGGYLAA